MAQQLPILETWTRARDRFVEDLTDAEKQIYYKGSLEMIYYDASVAQKRHEEVSASKFLIDKLQPLVTAIDQYAEALDVHSNAYPLALSLLWGSLRIVLHVSLFVDRAFRWRSHTCSSLVNSESTSKSSWICLKRLDKCFPVSGPMSGFFRTTNALSI